MSFLQFDKTQLINLEYSLSKEILLANPSGAYASSTIIGCNTRKYHGLLVAPISDQAGARHVLLSSLDETVIQHDQEFNLGIHRYPGEYYPKGHKYARWFEMDPVWKMVYRVGGVVLEKEILLDEKEPRLLVKYTLLEANSTTKLRIKPFLAFRNIHDLSKANMEVNKLVTSCRNGVYLKLYQDYPGLFLQTSRATEFIAAPDWYHDIEYLKEQKRGYPFHEDLYVPGYFETHIRTGESIIMAAGFEEQAPGGLKKRFDNQIAKTPLRNTFEEVLAQTAKSFIIEVNGRPEIVSGYHWFGSWGRNCWIALPGLTLATHQPELFENLAKSLVRMLKNGLFPNHSPDRNNPVYRSVDGSLWLIWALQQYASYLKDRVVVWKTFGSSIKEVLLAYRDGINPGIKMQDNGLLYAYIPNLALTWMSAYLNGVPVTPRPGLTVEVNALWYNAISFAVHAATDACDTSFVNEWKDIPAIIEESFQKTFWSDQKQYLADYVFEGKANWDVRPNQILAVSMPFSPLMDEQKRSILEIVQSELLTPKGLRTLSPRHEDYKTSYEGDHATRDLAYHQGTVRPWLFGHFAQGWLKLYGKSGKLFIKTMVHGFEEDMFEHGLGTISEVYDGNPPHTPCGAISSAASVAEVLRVMYLLKKI
ncbi:MAG: amylo-alpha-1,6-glucosidase [Bacteroidales bacterium]|jgi:predicted glycogen debranching enzyme